MSWKMTLNPVIHSYFMDGKDNKKRVETFDALVEKYSKPEFKALQVGVFSLASSKYAPNWVSIDKFDQRDCIDFNMDLSDLRFQDSLFDMIVCNAVLEHVKNPFKCAEEMRRVLKPGGEIWIEVPFVQPYHPSKDYNEDLHGIIDYRNRSFEKDQNHGGDYWRFTTEGIVELMKPLQVIDLMLATDGGIVFYGQK